MPNDTNRKIRKERVDKVMAALRSPVTGGVLGITGLGGGFATVLGSMSLASYYADTQSVEGAILTGATAGAGLTASFMLVNVAGNLGEIFSDNKAIMKKAVSRLTGSTFKITVSLSMAVGAIFTVATLSVQESKRINDAEDARIAALPELKAQSYLPPETAAQRFCQKGDKGRTIAVETIDSNGKPTEFRLACP